MMGRNYTIGALVRLLERADSARMVALASETSLKSHVARLNDDLGAIHTALGIRRDNDALAEIARLRAAAEPVEGTKEERLQPDRLEWWGRIYDALRLTEGERTPATALGEIGRLKQQVLRDVAAGLAETWDGGDTTPQEFLERYPTVCGVLFTLGWDGTFPEGAEHDG